MTEKKSRWPVFRDFIYNQYLYVILCILSLMILILCMQDTINYDEYFSMQWCRLDWGALLRRLVADVHPPLYYFMLKPLFDFSKESMFLARLLSAAFGIIVLWTGSWFLDRNFGRKSTLFFIGFLFLNPFMVQKVTEIRMYMAASAFTVISGMMALHILKEPKQKNWILFVFSSLLAAYTHYYALLSMVFLYAGILLYFAFTRCRKGILDWLLCSLFTIMGYLPWLPVAFRQINSVNQDFWVTAPSSRLSPLRELFYTRIPYTEHVYLGIMVLLTVVSVFLLWKKRTAEAYWSCMCCSALWGTYLLAYWYSTHIRPILLSRYLIMAICLAVIGVSYTARFLNKYIILIICLYCTLIGGNLYIRYMHGAMTERNTTRTVAFAKENFKEGDIILYNVPVENNYRYFDFCLEYYFPGICCINLAELQTTEPEYEMPDEGATVWLLDTSHSIPDGGQPPINTGMENCGRYGFASITFDVYRMEEDGIFDKAAHAYENN